MKTHTSSSGTRRPARRLLDANTISDRLAVVLRWAAGGWLTVVTIGFVVAAFVNGIPRSPSRGDWEIYAQLALLALVVIGGIVMVAHEGTGAAIVTAAGVGLGTLASLEHPPIWGLLVALAFYLPALLHWLAWQRTKPLWEVGLVAVGLALALAVGGWQSLRTYDTYFGPVQPESETAAVPAGLVEWIWSGGVTETEVTVKAKLAHDNEAVRLVVSKAPDLIAPIHTESQAVYGTAYRVASFRLTGLEANTKYWYALEADGALDDSHLGTFRTFPSGADSFTFAFGSCASEGSNGAVFDTIRELDPLFFLAAGDFFYSNIEVDDPAQFEAAYDANLTAPAQAALYRSTSVAYTWDDHDFGPNDADSTSPSRPAAQGTYRQVVPHYSLAAGGTTGPIYQAFTVGRVRFIVTDNRSERSPEAVPDDANKTMLGAEQKAWFKQELVEANGAYPLIVWVNPVPWIAEAGEGAFGWGAYATERRELADFIAENKIQGLAMLSGDAHMLAIDDGTNSDYSTNGYDGFPIFHAAALDRHGSAKGGPYSEGSFPDGGQFGLVTVIDNGGATIKVAFSGRTWEDDEVVSYEFSVPAQPLTSSTALSTVTQGPRDASAN